MIRTRFFDDFLLDACERSGIRQVVLAAAGMDTRAFRLDWPPQTRLFEMDLPEVLEAKDRVIEGSGIEERCERRTVAVDLEKEDWPEALLAAGYDAQRPSAWLVEGLLFYLSGTDVRGLLGKIGALATPGSLLGLDVMNRNMLLSPGAWTQLAALARRGARGRFGTNDPEALLAHHGGTADVTQPGEEGADFGRWTGPAFPRRLPGLPRNFLVRAQRSGPPEPSR